MSDFDAIPNADAPVENLLDIPEINNVQMSPAVAVGSVALNFAMKYHDIGTVQDGTLYQQYKLEGKNLTELHLDMVFETAKKIELHLMGTANRLSNLVFDAMFVGEDADPEFVSPPSTDSGRAE